jgi:hypothetical protein
MHDENLLQDELNIGKKKVVCQEESPTRSRRKLSLSLSGGNGRKIL